MNKKKIILISILSVVAIGGIIGAFFIFRPKQVLETNIAFLSVDSKEADSLLKLMTVEQKVAQVLFTNSDSIQNVSENNFGAIFLTSDSLEDFQDSYKKLVLETTITPFVCQNSDILIPQLFSKYFNLPSFEALLSIRDSVLRIEYLKYANRQDSIFGVNFNFVSLINKVSDTNNYDVDLIKYYQDYTKIVVDEFLSENVLVSIPFIELSKNDSVFGNLWKNFYLEQKRHGIPSLYAVDNKQLSDFAEENKYNGILIANSSDFDDLDMFWESNFDMIMVNNSTEDIYNKLVEKVKEKKKFEKKLDIKVHKILLAKSWLKNNNNSIREINLTNDDITNTDNQVFFRKLLKYSPVLLKNDKNYLPVFELNEKFECFVFGEKNTEEFINVIKKYTGLTSHYFEKNPVEDLSKIKIYGKPNLIFVLNNIKIDTAFLSKLIKYDTTYNVTIVNFNEISNLTLLENTKHLIHFWNNDDVSQSYAAQIIFGGIGVNAKLPFTLSDSLQLNTGLTTTRTRLGYDIPEMVGVSSERLLALDSIVNDAIGRYVFPGCQVFAAKDGVVIIDNSYGYHTYAHQNRVKHDDLYDIASITKVVATTLSAMKMFEQGKLPLDKNLEGYFRDTKIEYNRIKPDTLIKIDTINKNEDKDWKKKIKGLDTVQIGDSIVISFDTVIYKLTPKNNIFKVTPRLLLTHKSGIQPALPILKLMLLDNSYFRRIKDLYAEGMDSVQNELSYKDKFNELYVNHYIKDSAEVQVAEGMYLKNAYFDTLWRDTKELPVWSKKVYIYSDVNMIILQMTIDSINGYGINVFTWKNFYKPLGLTNITYLPRKLFNRSQIVPTERDTYWRRQLIWGYVHDPSAALLGGVSGNAGLFSNAYSLGVVAQMLLNGGSYGGRRFLAQTTIDKFTATQPETHRGLGFDKWSKKQIIAKDASPNTYGHTGFTGACLWADPDNEIVFVFLSNRVHPSANNWKIISFKVRQKVHQAIYDARIK
ncbi:MAG: serine hydrolase [Bacteroidales bacterium]|nr:serine hydrolase [Bacteroidales bacterium]